MLSNTLSDKKKKLFKLFAGFSAVGIIVTLFSMALIYLFLEVFQTPLIVTYVVIYLVSIILSYFLNANLVYKADKNRKQFLFYIIIYVSSMLLGVVLLWIFQKTLSFENWVLGYMVIPFTMVWNFILSTLLLTTNKK